MVVAALDSTPGQVAADLVLLALVALNIYLGFRYGLLRRIVALVGLYVACLAATNLGNPVASVFGARSESANAMSFVAVFVAVAVVFEVMGALLHERLQRVVVVVFDRVSGSLLGAAVGLGEALVLFLVVFAVSSSPGTAVPRTTSPGETPAHAVGSATVAGQAVRLEPQLVRALASVLPADLSAHLQEGTAAASSR